MKALTVRNSDLDRCPAHRLDAGHYNEDGTCRCPPPPPADPRGDALHEAWKAREAKAGPLAGPLTLEATQYRPGRWRVSRR
jgi:hypothetical protein